MVIAMGYCATDAAAEVAAALAFVIMAGRLKFEACASVLAVGR